MSRRSFRWLVFSFFLLFLAPQAHAQWVLHGAAAANVGAQTTEPVSVSDGAGGVIVAWVDNRSLNNDVYAQRLNAQGVPQWTADGVVICNATQNQFRLDITTDGAGGAIITWSDYRTNGVFADIYVQRVNSAGVVQWTANGVIMVNDPADQFEPKLVSDGAGGAIVCWTDPRSGAYDVYARKVNSAGTPQWAANGVALVSWPGDQRLARIVSDGAGGAVVAWRDDRTGPTNRDVYARRVDSAGTVLWTVNGVAICAAPGHQEELQLIADGSGGAIITWQDARGGVTDIYAQRVSGAGSVQWTNNGVQLVFDASAQSVPTITTDGAGGAIIAWQDARSGATDIYVRRITSSGAPVWTLNGVLLSGAVDVQGVPLAVSDGAGGAIVAWKDARGGAGFDVYARRVSASGAPMWTTDGVPLCVMNDDQSATSIVANGSGGAIVTWADFRSIFYTPFCQRVEPNFGYWGYPEPIVTSVADIRHDQGGKVKVNWTASGRDRIEPRNIGHYTIWRAIDVALIGVLPSTLKDITRTDTKKPGPVFATFGPTIDYYWELVGSQEAHAFKGYTFSAATRADSVLNATNNEVFMVMAHNENDDFIAFASNAVTGHSVDNLAPDAPLMLIAQRSGANVNLKWNRVRVPDLDNYSVYRKTSAGVTPLPPNFLANSDDSVLVDTGAPATALYYIVTARDVHGNQSAPSNEANVSAATGVGDTPAISELTVLQNRPNPFASTTELQIGLPASSKVDVVVYDIAGRRVREMTITGAQAGWKSVRFDGKDNNGNPLASGVYFYRVSALGKTITNKMVITR